MEKIEDFFHDFYFDQNKVVFDSLFLEFVLIGLHLLADTFFQIVSFVLYLLADFLKVLNQMPSSATGTADPMSIISYLNSNITVEISHLNPVVCIILLVLSAIFGHAAKLQKQSDEML